MALRCESGLVLCRTPADGQCAVCGRYFCAKHGDPDAPHCRRCTRAFAVRQRDAAAAVAETVRRETAAVHNSDGRCGWANCAEPPLAQCDHDGLHYCSRHANRYNYRYRYRTRRGVEMRAATVTLCDACKPQLRLYKREKTWLEV